MKFDLFGPVFKANPYPTYAVMRESDPIHQRVSGDGKHTIWFITRYVDVTNCLRDHRRFVKNVQNTLTPEEKMLVPPTPDLVKLLSNHMLNLDAPDHTRLRALVNKAFTANVITQLQPRIQAIADELLDRVQRRGAMDLIDEYAFPLPITVIAELLGIPPEDRRRFRTWSGAFVTPSTNLERSTKKYQKTRLIMEDFTRYLSGVFAERRREPREDLITSLLQAEEQGDRLSEQELFSMVILLIVAGHETSVNLIGNGVLALLQHPDQRQLLCEQMGLLPSAIEEMVRYDGPVERATMRFAVEEIEMGERTIRRGDAVSLVLAAADRDPRQFDQPDTFDITRQNNRHLGFGLGSHYCLGSTLARLEGQIALQTLLHRLPRIQLTTPVETLRWRKVPILRGLHHLPVSW